MNIPQHCLFLIFSRIYQLPHLAIILISDDLFWFFLKCIRIHFNRCILVKLSLEHLRFFLLSLSSSRLAWMQNLMKSTKSFNDSNFSTNLLYHDNCTTFTTSNPVKTALIVNFNFNLKHPPNRRSTVPTNRSPGHINSWTTMLTRWRTLC